MPKILFPRNIQKGIFASLTFNIGPFSVTLIQLLILAIGIAGFLGIFQLASSSGFGRVVAIIMALPILLIFIFIAFFKVSELSLIPFVAKYIRTYFLDSAEKFQVNFAKDSEVDLIIKKQKWKEKKQTADKKTLEVDKSSYDKYKESWLI